MKRKLLVLVSSLLLTSAAWASDDLIRTPDQINPSQGRVLVHQDAAHHVKTLRVRIAPNTDMPAHGPDNGYFIATVLSGTLQLGIGPKFDADKLRTLPPGSVFSHSSRRKHFARTGEQAVVLQVTMISDGNDNADSATHKH